MTNDECFEYYLDTVYSIFACYDSDGNVEFIMYVKDYLTASYVDGKTGTPLMYVLNKDWKLL